MSESILNLFNQDSIVQCKPAIDQFISVTLLTDKPSGKKSFILNLKYSNLFLLVPLFKMEDTKTICRLTEKCIFPAFIDLITKILKPVLQNVSSNT